MNLHGGRRYGGVRVSCVSRRRSGLGVSLVLNFLFFFIIIIVINIRGLEVGEVMYGF